MVLPKQLQFSLFRPEMGLAVLEIALRKRYCAECGKLCQQLGLIFM